MTHMTLWQSPNSVMRVMFIIGARHLQFIVSSEQDAQDFKENVSTECFDTLRTVGGDVTGRTGLFSGVSD